MALTTVPASLSATALTLTTAAQPNITSVGTLTGLTVSGNIAGTLTTAAQTNITSLGTLTALTSSGDITISTGSGTGGRYLILDNTDTGGRDYRLISTNNAHGSLGGGNFAILDYDVSGNDAAKTRLLINSSGNVQARRARSNTAGEVALSVQPSDSVIHYGFRIDSNTNSFNLDRADSGNEAQLLSVDASGNVGIGVASPGAVLSLPAGESNTPRFAIESAVDDNDFTITQYEDGNGTYTMLGQNVKLNSGGNNTVLDSAHRTAGIVLDARNHGAITFITGAANAATENVKIDSSGNVGIGNTSPSSYYSTFRDLVIGDGSGDHGITIATGTSGAGTLAIADGTSGNTAYRAYFQYSNNTDKLFLGAGGDTRLTVKGTDGNVGIGETNPASKLHITTGNSTGEIRLSTSISHGGSGGTNNKLSFYNTANSASEMGSIRAVQHNQYTYGNIDVYVNNANTLALNTRFNYGGQLIVGSTTTSHTDETKVILHPSGGQTNTYNMSATNEWWIMNNLASNSGYTTKIDFRTQNTSRGYIGITGSTVIYYSNSDYRLKENYNYDFDATSLVKAMKPLEFTWKDEPMVGKQMGFLAHELKEVTPYVVQGDKDEMRDDGEIRPQVVDQGKLVAVLTKALQEALVRIETLETEVTALKG